MKSFMTKTGEVAFVPTESELEIIHIALRQFRVSLWQFNSLSRNGEVGA